MGPDAFLAWERTQPTRHVYLRGEVFAMAGGSPRHSRFASRVIAKLDLGLTDKSCDVHTSDLRLALGERHFVYADAVVVRRPLEFRPGTTDVVTDPTVVIEVLSASTEAYDRGEKQAGYLALPSVAHLLLVAQREVRVELYSRQDDGSFRFTVYGPGAQILLPAIGVTLTVDELYQGAFELPGDDGAARG
jgi:Uma2 family endonuclease